MYKWPACSTRRCRQCHRRWNAICSLRCFRFCLSTALCEASSPSFRQVGPKNPKRTALPDQTTKEERNAVTIAGIASLQVSQIRWQPMAPTEVPKIASAPIAPIHEPWNQIVVAPKSSTKPTSAIICRFNPYLTSITRCVSKINFCQPKILMELAKRKNADRSPTMVVVKLM